MNGDISRSKRTARNNMRSIIAAVPREKRSEWSARIAGHVISLPEWKESQTVLAFLPMEDEVDTTGILEKAFSEQKTVAVPRMHPDHLQFHKISSLTGPWEHHPFGVRQPPATLPVVDPCDDASEQVLVITPGLCFDRRGGRLGFGKGYYDRVLSSCRRERSGKVFFAAVSFSIQLVDKVPVGPHDCSVDAVITERGIEFRCGPHGIS